MDQKPVLLIIDDSVEDIDVLRELFKQEYVIMAAKSGEQGLSIVEGAHPPDLILLDVVMPGMDGFEVSRRIRVEERHREIPIIFLTARTDLEDKIRGFTEGGVDYVTKPFESREIVARVHTHMELIRARKLIQAYNSELETMLAERTRELVQAERKAAFAQMVQGIVHNIRNPLSGILGSHQMMEIILEDLRETLKGIDDGSNKFAEMLNGLNQMNSGIGRAADQMDQLISALLAKSKSDKIKHLETVDINEVIRLEVDFLNADLRFRHNLGKELDLYEGPLLVEVIPAEVSQIVENLVYNALDAMEGMPSRQLIFRTGRRHDRVFFSVTDHGPGIPADIRNRVFEPFFSTKTKNQNVRGSQGGMGLGLWMCLETVNSYGGEIFLETQSGHGTIFTVLLPESKSDS